MTEQREKRDAPSNRLMLISSPFPQSWVREIFLRQRPYYSESKVAWSAEDGQQTSGIGSASLETPGTAEPTDKTSPSTFAAGRSKGTGKTFRALRSSVERYRRR